MIARATGGDWPGTLGVRVERVRRTGGYDGDVLFENLELVRTIRAAGGRERIAFDLFVARRPPVTRRFIAQRVRQAYDEHARPARLAAQLALAPLLAAAVWRFRARGVLACATAAIALAEAGRRRDGGARVFAPVASLCAPAWVLERAVTVVVRARVAVRRRRAVLARQDTDRGALGADASRASARRAARARGRGAAVSEASVEHLERAWRNPYDSDAARANSSYHAGREDGVVRLLEAAPANPFARIANAAFRSFVLDDRFSCLGAKSSIRRELYRIGTYARMDDAAVTEGLARDLYAFAEERRGLASDFTTYIAVFRERAHDSEEAFERALWSQLQRLHDLDARHHGWDARVSSDPDDPAFSFSIAGTAFFVVGLHPAASRTARRFAWPTLVFNAHEQFEHLREDGRFGGLQRQIRARELSLDGDLNPNLADYGAHSEARQYSGRAVDETWTCPFVRRS